MDAIAVGVLWLVVKRLLLQPVVDLWDEAAAEPAISCLLLQGGGGLRREVLITYS